MSFFKKHKTVCIEWAIITLLFFVSLIARASEFDRPLQNTHEWLTAHATITQQLWIDGGWKQHWFSPIITLTNVGDQFVPFFANVMSGDGEVYYMSYPPFLFIAPFLAARTIGAEPSVATTEGFNMLLHFLGAILLVLLIKKIIPSSPDSPNPWAIVGGVLFLFLPGNLWNFQNVYFANTLSIIFFIVGIILFVYIVHDLRERQRVSRVQLWALGITAFFFAYTEWLSVFWAAPFLFYVSLYYRKESRSIRCIIIGAFLGAAVLTAYQYGHVVNIADAARALTLKGLERSHPDGNEILAIAKYYLLYYLPLLGVLFAIAASSIHKIGGSLITLTKDQQAALFISFFPVVLYHVALPQFSGGHDFSVLIGAPFFIVITIIAARLLLEQWIEKRKVVQAFCILGALSLFFLATSFSLYRGYFITGAPWRLEERGSFEPLGRYIEQNVGRDEYAFFQYDDSFQSFCAAFPQIMYYARRNIQCVSSHEEAEQFIESVYPRSGITKGVIVHVGKHFVPIRVERISLR